MALGSLAAYKMRTALTVLGNVVAVSSVIAVVSLIAGMDVFVREEIADEGSNVLTLERVDALQILSDMDAFLESLHNPPITLHDYRALREDGLAAVERMAAFDGASGRVDAPNRSASGVNVQGWTAEYPSFVRRELAQGRHFNEFEVRNSRAVAVVGSEIAERIVRSENAVGKTIRVNGRHVEIIGVLAEEKSVLGNNPNRIVLIPLGQHLKIFGGNGVQVRLLARGVEMVDEAREEVRWWMRIRHGLRPADRDDFAVTSSERTVALWKSISGMIFQVLILLVSVSLVVGGVVIMNIMLVSVTERTKEVGTRMALGARRFDILWQFLVESVTLSMLGGLIGIVLGFGVASIVSWLTPLPYAVQPWAIVAGLAVTFVVGVFFGIYPANRAARLDPVEALRRE
ncbi:ABC transporter permease [bacterium]|nr:ABC transporter permease [bacterium]